MPLSAAPPAVRLPPEQVGGPGRGGQRRRPYTTGEARLIAQLYPTCTAAALAQRLGRTVGSVRYYVATHPALRKQGRP